MSRHRNLANRSHEDEGRLTTRSVSRHGLKKRLRRLRTLRNRAAKEADHRLALNEGRADAERHELATATP
jgi:hypothetical protein